MINLIVSNEQASEYPEANTEKIISYWQLVEMSAKTMLSKLQVPELLEASIENEHQQALRNLLVRVQEQVQDLPDKENDSVE
ncbi:hypothetical protein LPR20_001337 [Vibrio mimicus]